MSHIKVLPEVTEVRLTDIDFQRLIIELSLAIIREPVERVDGLIGEALARIGQFVGADRAYRFRYDWHRETCSNTHEWCAPGIEPCIADLQENSIGELSHWCEPHKRGEPFLIADVLALEMDNPLRAILEPQGILSLITVPLFADGVCAGFVGFDAVRVTRGWDSHNAGLLRLLASLLEVADTRLVRERERQTVLAELAVARDEAMMLCDVARGASAAKSQFVASVSHEIRTPLHVILGMTRELKEQPLADSALRYVDAIDLAGRALGGLLEDVLEVSRIEAGKLQLHLAPFSPAAMSLECQSLFEFEAQRKRLGLSVSVQENVPDRLLGDSAKIRQILINLLGNAVKYSDAGEVSLALSYVPEAGEQAAGSLCLEVADQGIGMDADTLHHLYEPFYRDRAQPAQQRPGTGLGMTVVKLLVDAMGGTVSVRSDPGVGSVFLVKLPLQRVVDEGSTAAPIGSASSALCLVDKRVLIAEDDRLSRGLLRAQLAPIAVQLTWAVDGELALDACRNAQFDLILMDCRMPTMSGLQAATHIRALGDWAATVPIIAMTAGTSAEEQLQCEQAGMSHFLAKPFGREQLLRVMEEVLAS